MADQITDWLADWQQQSATSISTGLSSSKRLEKVAQIGKRLGIITPEVPVITVAGTNGKGSCVALLEAIYLAAGYRVAAATSPHLYRVNERVRINGQPVRDEILYQALIEVAAMCHGTYIAYFTLLLLAGLIVFHQQSVDVILIEVGIGGRFDATNIIDADVAIITSIGLDHCHLLGESREAIAWQKSGIARRQCPLICGDPNPPANLEKQAAIEGAIFYQWRRDFTLIRESDRDYWSDGQDNAILLPPCQIVKSTIAAAIMAVMQCQPYLPLSTDAIYRGVATVNIPARCQYITGQPALLVDVAHNIQAVDHLSRYLTTLPISGKIHAVTGWLADKKGVDMVKRLQRQVDNWYFCDINHERSGDMALAAAWVAGQGHRQMYCPSPRVGMDSAIDQAGNEDLVIVWGSFYLIVDALPPTLIQES